MRTAWLRGSFFTSGSFHMMPPIFFVLTSFPIVVIEPAPAEPSMPSTMSFIEDLRQPSEHDILHWVEATNYNDR